jgi:hypothetical protein
MGSHSLYSTLRYHSASTACVICLQVFSSVISAAILFSFCQLNYYRISNEMFSMVFNGGRGAIPHT